MLDKKDIENNIMGIKETLQKVTKSIYTYIDKNYGLKPHYEFELVNNYDFYKDMNMIDFIRDVGKYYRMSNLLAKETIANRLNSEAGISFTEFTYTVLQGYDFEKLFLEKNCILQLGGSDQWGNIMSGYELIKKKHR